MGGAWDGALPLADQADITTGGPTLEYADFDPRTTPAGEAAVWHFTATGIGSYDVLLFEEPVFTVTVGDSVVTIQAAFDGFAPDTFVVGGTDWSDWTLSPVGVGASGADTFTLDDTDLVAGGASITQTAPGRDAGLVRPWRSRVVVAVDDFTKIDLVQTSDDPSTPAWERAGSRDRDTGVWRSTVESRDAFTSSLSLSQGGEFEEGTYGAVAHGVNGHGVLTLVGHVTWLAGHTNSAGAITLDLVALVVDLADLGTVAVDGVAGTWVGLVNGTAAGGVVLIASGVLTFVNADGSALTTPLIEDDTINFQATIPTSAG